MAMQKKEENKMVNIYSKNEYFGLLGLTTPLVFDERTGMHLSLKLTKEEKRAILYDVNKSGRKEDLIEEAGEFFKDFGSAYVRNEEGELEEFDFFDAYQLPVM